MSKFNFLKLNFFVLVFFLSACSLNPSKQAEKNPIVPHPDWNIEEPADKGYKSVKSRLAAQSKMKKFQSKEELAEFLQNNETSSSYYSESSMRNEDLMEKSVSPSSAPQMGLDYATDTSFANQNQKDSDSIDYSETNVQVEGVDEADIIKTDGKYIYAISKNNLFIIEANPAEKSEILAKIEFKSRPNDLYINGDFLAIFGMDNQVFSDHKIKKIGRRNNFAFFKIFDISDRREPKQIRDLDIEGAYSSSRMIGDYVYFVTTNRNYYYIQDEPVLPRILEDGEIISNDCVKAVSCFNPDVYYFDIPYESYNFTNVTAINIKNKDENFSGEAYLMSSSQNIFVSKDNIYLTYTKYISEYELEMEVIREMIYPKLSTADREKIAKIEAVENFILNKFEKDRKIFEIIERFGESLASEEQDKLEEELEERMKSKYEDISKELEKTVIHKIEIEKGNLSYKVTGEANGHVLNQFSMDEHDGYFRIATTKNRTWSRYLDDRSIESYNNLYVFDKNLKQVGAVEKLAEGERIYSVRFMQNRAYMVTFKQIDPLFVIDLKDPKNPQVLGELKIPGFSNYLHPYDEDTLIGLGKDAFENEWGGVRTGGVKLSLFDVSDVSSPKEIDNYIMGGVGSDSVALNDHKAFLFSHDKNLLVIPVAIQESSAISPVNIDNNDFDNISASRQVRKYFRGAAVFNVNKEGFELVGRIDHGSDYQNSGDRDYWRGYSYYDNTVKRSLYIEDILYTFSNNYILMNDLEDLDLIKKLELKKEKKEKEDDFEVIN